MAKRAYQIAFEIDARFGKKFGKVFSKADAQMMALSKTLGTAGKTMTAAVTAPLVGIGAASVKAAMDWESAWTSVVKVTDAPREALEELEATARSMARELPHSHAAIAAVFEAGSRLGVTAQHLEGFSRTMLAVEATTTLALDSAATGFAQIANIMGTSQGDFDRMGSTILYLGSNFATTENDILGMTQRMAGATSQIGMTEAQTMGFATAIGALGMEVASGGSTFARFSSDMARAVAIGGEELDSFARVAGVSSERFATAFEQDATDAILQFISGLGRLENQGENVLVTLDDMGLSGIQMERMLLGLVGGYDTLVDALGSANTAWEENEFLTYAVAERYGTMQASMDRMQNQIRDAGITIGSILAPKMEMLVERISSLVEWFSNLDSEQQANIVRWAAIAAAIGPALLILSKLAKAIVMTKNAFRQLKGVLTVLGKPFGMLNDIIYKKMMKTMPKYNAVVTKAALATHKHGAAVVATSGKFAFMTKVLGVVKGAFLKLKAVMLANPIGAVIAGVAALTAGIIALVRWLTNKESRYRELAEAAEYLRERQEALSESALESATAFAESSQRMAISQASIQGMAETVEYLASKSSLLPGELATMNHYIEQLNGSIPGLNLAFDDYAGTLNMTTDAMEAYISLAQRQEQMTAQLEERTRLAEEALVLEQGLAEAAELRAGIEAKLNDGTRRHANQVRDLNSALDDATAAELGFTESLAANAQQQAEMTHSINENAAALQRYEEAQRQAALAAEENAAQAAAFTERITSIVHEMNELKNAYNATYEAALRSIQGQYSIWDTAADVVATSVEEMNAAMGTQIAHWESYESNIASLTDRASDIEGLGEMIGSFADGSIQSVNAIAGMADATDEEITQMVADWQRLQEIEDRVAHGIAELVHDYTARLAEMEAEMQSTVDALEMSEDAANAAAATMEGYLNSLVAGGEAAIAEAQRIAAAITAALNSASGSVSISVAGSHADGLSYVPYDGYVAELHKGERVLTAEENVAISPYLMMAMSSYRKAGSLGSDSGNADSGPTMGDIVDIILKAPSPSNTSGGGDFNYNCEITINGSGLSANDLEDMLKRRQSEERKKFADLFEELFEDMQDYKLRMSNS